MTDSDLIRRAQALGVSASYLDWRKRRVRVPPETLIAIIGALGEQADLAVGPAEPSAAAPGRYAARPGPRSARPRIPRRRSWGFTVQLYSVRSRRSWGHGDLRDLADLAIWSARELGAGFVLVNPLHAAEPGFPVSPSPYRPMTRRFISPLYLRIEDIPEYAELTAAQRRELQQLAAPLREASTSSELIDRDAVWAAKLRALELIHSVRRPDHRESAYRAFTERAGAELAHWSTWCALAERHGPDWRHWPAEFRNPRQLARRPESGLTVDDARSADLPGLAGRAEFHAWLQWLLDEQLAAAQGAALAAGMDIGVIGDLAVGVHPGGADAWAHQDLLVPGMSVGAPPDGFNQRGQNWAQPPWHPQRLAATGGRPLAELFAAAFRHVGGLRMDHVMGLMRLWWVPDGMPPDRGAYVSYNHQLTVAALAGEAARAGAVAIGEDLGTVDQWIRRYLAASGILGTSLLWFAREPDGSPLRPAHWRRSCMATVGTHDVPPVSGFVTGDQVAVRARLGLLKDPQAERKSSELALQAWQDVLTAQRLLPPGHRPSADEFTVALYGYLALTPAALVGVSLADAVGDRRTQNIPGTSDEYPNWRIPLCNGNGEAVLIEDLPSIDLVRAVVRAAGR